MIRFWFWVLFPFFWLAAFLRALVPRRVRTWLRRGRKQ